MKNFQKISLGLLVGAVAIAFSSFTSMKKLSSDFYAPLSSTLSPTSPAAQDFSSYNSSALDADPGCSGSTNVCAAEFPNTAQPPVQIESIDPN